MCSGEHSISESSRNDLSANITIIVGHHVVPSAPTPWRLGGGTGITLFREQYQMKEDLRSVTYSLCCSKNILEIKKEKKKCGIGGCRGSYRAKYLLMFPGPSA